MALLVDFTPTERVERASGTINIFSDISGGLGPVIGLPLVDSFEFTLIYSASTLFPLLGVVVLLAGFYWQTDQLFPLTRIEQTESTSS